MVLYVNTSSRSKPKSRTIKAVSRAIVNAAKTGKKRKRRSKGVPRISGVGLPPRLRMKLALTDQNNVGGASQTDDLHRYLVNSAHDPLSNEGSKQGAYYDKFINATLYKKARVLSTKYAITFINRANASVKVFAYHSPTILDMSLITSYDLHKDKNVWSATLGPSGSASDMVRKTITVNLPKLYGSKVYIDEDFAHDHNGDPQVVEYFYIGAQSLLGNTDTNVDWNVDIYQDLIAEELVPSEAHTPN